eukprot:TRINITY_DN11930_c0_g1_i1.p1 TRINITY_DN11930_c0_g1~~TRINITY_DN11930_c0_g1_i1.p1  ORF type:complete len:413 (-),score=63.59 TRINITY_DN11930_c0_g1_i1:121-1359(-)
MFQSKIDAVDTSNIKLIKVADQDWDVLPDEFLQNLEIVPNEHDPTELGDGALILYTSGTTGRPKGVLHRHRNVQAQIDALVGPWKWTSTDHTLNLLPLHHMHGVLCIMECALYAGAHVSMYPGPFDAAICWQLLRKLRPSLNVFMSVPTIYAKLVQHWEEEFGDAERKDILQRLKQYRLMVSGSMSLPAPLFNKWNEISGHRLLERYGMTEFGMSISNPYEKELRKPGTVGFPLPGVTIRINTNGEGKEDGGGLEVKGLHVFEEYWNNPEATAKEFTQDGFFKTGDRATIASYDGKDYVKILGRESVDIIKSGGFKISALEIERAFLEHPLIQEVAVLGVPDEQMGQLVTALIVLKKESDNAASECTPESLRSWAKKRITSYKVPKEIIISNKEIPKNAMGKVNKKDLLKTL